MNTVIEMNISHIFYIYKIERITFQKVRIIIRVFMPGLYFLFWRFSENRRKDKTKKKKENEILYLLICRIISAQL